MPQQVVLKADSIFSIDNHSAATYI